MKIYQCIIFLLTLFITVSSPVHASASAEQSFSKGTQSFKDGRFNEAIQYFKKSENMGLKTPSLFFNLGSSYYKAGQYQQSINYFKKLRQYPHMIAIASYNLGLTHKKMGAKKSAQKWFTWVINNSSNKKLITLSDQQIKKTDKNKKKWSVYSSLSLGNDSNIDAAPNGTALEQSDNFIKLYLNSDYILSGNRKDGWLASAGLYRIDYSDFSINDTAQYNVAVKRKLYLFDWKTHFKAKALKSTYNSADYQTVLTFEAAATNILSKENKLRLRYRYSDINSDNIAYDYLEGNKQQLRLELKHKNNSYKQKFYYEYETNNREDSAALSYSPKRHTLKGMHTIQASRNIQWGGEISYRQSNYPVISSNNRDGERWKYGVFGSYRFDKTSKLKAKIIHTNNESKSSLYDYDKNIISLTLSKTF